MSGGRNLASKPPFSFLKSGAAPFFTRNSRYFLFWQKGCWVRRLFREAQSMPKLCAQSAFEAHSVSTKRGRDLRHDPPDPPQTTRGPKKNQNAFQLPLVSGHPSRAMFQNELFLLNNVEPPQKISARSVGAAILVPPTPSSPPGRNNVRKGHRFLSLNAPRASPRPLKPNNVRKGHRFLTLNAPRASPQTPKAK